MENTSETSPRDALNSCWNAEKNAENLCAQLLQELRHFSGTALQADDLTMVVVRAV